MIRFIVLTLVALGAGVAVGMVSHKVPVLGNVAFNVGSFGITWFLLAVCALVFVGYKATK